MPGKLCSGGFFYSSPEVSSIFLLCLRVWEVIDEGLLGSLQECTVEVDGDCCHALLGEGVDEWLDDARLSLKNSEEKDVEDGNGMRRSALCDGRLKKSCGWMFFLVKEAAFVGCVARLAAVLLMGAVTGGDVKKRVFRGGRSLWLLVLRG